MDDGGVVGRREGVKENILEKRGGRNGVLELLNR